MFWTWLDSQPVLLSHPATTILEITKLIGLISSTVQAVLPACLQLRYLQQQQIQSLNQACLYQAEIVLNSLSKQELLWWAENLRLNNKWSLRQKKPNFVMQTDASKSGWTVFCSVNLEEMVRTGNEFAHKFSEINSSKFCDSNIDKSTIKYSNSVAEWKLDVSIFQEIERHMGQPILDLLDLLSRSASRL